MRPSRRVLARRLPPLMRFRDVVVQRHEGRRNPGAAWPDFAAQFHARHLKGLRPVCLPPPPPEGEVGSVDEPCAFIAPHDAHFGHFVAEAASRLPQTLAELSDDTPLVFTCRVDLTPDRAAPAFMAVLDWLGVAPARLRFVRQPHRFRNLSVAGQAEHLDGPAPAPDYLRLLETMTARHDLPPRPETILYVSRAGLPPFRGGHGGEAYLEACLRELGVPVLRPEAAPLPEQMRAYAGARSLIFAEGSAVHGRQLLGRIDQDVAILQRRIKAWIAPHGILARSGSVEYVPVLKNELYYLSEDGKRWPHSTIGIYDQGCLLDWFDGIGVPLRRIWDPAHHARAQDARILDWFRATYDPRRTPWQRPANGPEHFVKQLRRLELEHLVGPVLAIIAAAGPQRNRAS